MGTYLPLKLRDNIHLHLLTSVIAFFIMMLLSGCAIFKTGVDVANNPGSIQDCEYLGVVYGTANNGEEEEEDWFEAGSSALFAKNNMKRQARRMGADTILIKDAELDSKYTTLKGEAYDCSNAAG